jgi:hypothetical protein
MAWSREWGVASGLSCLVVEKGVRDDCVDETTEVGWARPPAADDTARRGLRLHSLRHKEAGEHVRERVMMRGAGDERAEERRPWRGRPP